MEFTVDEVIDSLGLKPLENGGWGRVMAAGEGTASSGVVSVYRLLTPELGEPVRVDDATQQFRAWWE